MKDLIKMGLTTIRLDRLDVLGLLSLGLAVVLPGIVLGIIRIVNSKQKKDK